MNTKIQAANAKPATSAHTFSIGDRAIVCNSKTEETEVLGVVTTIAKGWYMLETEEYGKVSARVSSLSPCDEDDLVNEMDDPEDLEQESDEQESDEQESDEQESDEQESDEQESDEQESDDEDTAASKMSAALKEARVLYVKTHRPDGTPSADCGDQIAKELRDLEPLEVAALADRALRVAKGTHAAKYGHLNMGQIRMNSGNRIRAAWKTANEDDDQATIDHLKFVLGLDGDEDDAE